MTQTQIEDKLAEVDMILYDSFNFGGCDYTLSGENTWATDIALEYILKDGNLKDAAREIFEGWEPSDQEMMSAFGTKWHDGL